MARPLRIQFPGAIYHITSRGNNKANIFLSNKDRDCFLEILSSTVERYQWICHSYCLMDNHYHLLIETINPNLSKGMRQLNGIYTQTFNYIHRKVGHIFQGRFKSILVEQETYLLTLCGYIVLNPVRAGMVEHPQQWPWSSYNATMGAVEKQSFLSTEWILSQFDATGDIIKARETYRDFVLTGEEAESPWSSLRSHFILGSDKYAKEIEQYITENKEKREHPVRERYVNRPDLKDIFRTVKTRIERNEKIYKAHVTYSYSQAEIAYFLGIHYSTVSVGIKTFEKNIQE
jgi:putative transposase